MSYTPSRKLLRPYENVQLPKRRGPLVTLAKLWPALPLPAELVDRTLPEPHKTFIQVFLGLFMRDCWYVTDYDMSTWAEDYEKILANKKKFKALTAFELRDILTWCVRCNYLDAAGGVIEQMVVNGEIQMLLTRLSELVASKDEYF